MFCGTLGFRWTPVEEHCSTAYYRWNVSVSCLLHSNVCLYELWRKCTHQRLRVAMLLRTEFCIEPPGIYNDLRSRCWWCFLQCLFLFSIDYVHQPTSNLWSWAWEGGPWYTWVLKVDIFLLNFQLKNVFLLVSSCWNEISPLLPSLEKSFWPPWKNLGHLLKNSTIGPPGKKTLRRPCLWCVVPI